MVEIALPSCKAQAGGRQSYEKALEEATQGIGPFLALFFFFFFSKYRKSTCSIMKYMPRCDLSFPILYVTTAWRCGL